MIIRAISKTTFLENIRQPVYLVLTAIGLSLIFLSQYVTLFSLGNETITIIETAFSTLLMVGLSIAIFSSSNLIYYEMESKTLMTVLSKPVTKEQIIIGKFIGIASAILLACLILLAAIFLTGWMSATANKDILFDAAFISELLKITVLTLSQLGILVSLTILFATTMPITLTAVFTILIFFLGHMQDALLHFFEFNKISRSFSWIYSLFIPNLEYHNLSQQLYSGIAIPTKYVILNVSYSVIYIAVYLLTAMILFKRKDFS